ncbi:hypothetical protein TNCV_2291571 [Trichonephila clavipes]|uniref:Uncharacterized protein n=1 Tax=Trichonephila clavipes TaxID=2585209 RepID=A0A8X6V7T3_TRICX|nr:hypothetical protein TNCV_2291571 [Trichonephila clavipes]
MLKPLRFDIFEPQETKLLVRLTNTTNERRLVRGHETQLKVKGNIEGESDPVDEETDEDQDNNNNESSKGPPNADAFSALETAMGVSVRFHTLYGSRSVFRVSEQLRSERSPVGIDSD